MSVAAVTPVSQADDGSYAQGPADAIDFSQVRRVLVTKMRHHGDVLLTTPVFAALKAAHPHLEIDALVYRETLPLIAHNPHLSVIHTIDKGWRKAGLRRQVSGESGLFAGLRARRYDLLIHLTDHNRGAWLSRLLAPRWSVGPQLRQAQAAWRRSFTHLYRSTASVPPGTPLVYRHTVEQNLDALRRLGLRIGTAPALTLAPGREAELGAAQVLQAAGVQPGGYIAMQPTSRWFFKTWPVQRNAELICALLARGETLILSCAPDAREQAMVRAIVDVVSASTAGQKPERLIVLSEGMTLGQLAVLIGHARLFIAIDSVPMHIAAAMGTPLVALFGPSSEKAWGPWQVRHQIVVQEQYPCRPCGQDGCGGGKISDCLTSLPVARVLQAIDALSQSPTGAA